MLLCTRLSGSRCTATLADICNMTDSCALTSLPLLVDGSWLYHVLQSGTAADRRALAAAVELSLRSNHPVSRAMALCGQAAAGKLPAVEITNFKLVPGMKLMSPIISD